MTSAPITATAGRVLGCCLACLLDVPHAQHDTNLPAAARASVTAPTPKGASR